MLKLKLKTNMLNLASKAYSDYSLTDDFNRLA